MKRLVRLGTLVAAVAAVIAAIRALRRDADPLPAPASSPSEPWPPLRAEDAAGEEAPADAVPTPDAAPVEDAFDESAEDAEAGPWVEPAEDGSCPDGHPIKANLSSKIFHSPGQLHYDRTTPDRCYVDAEAAEADGLRAAKR